ncbi:MAG: serine protease [Oligoflexales bacterium]
MNHYQRFQCLLYSRNFKLFLLIWLCLNGALSSQAQETYENSVQLKSSVMWRPFSKHIYPPGIPAVLEKTDDNRFFKIEQYYSKQVDSNVIKVYVRGPWRDGMMQSYMEEWRNDYLSISKPECDDQASLDADGNLLGYRCEAYLEVEQDIPSGAIGIAMAYKAWQGEVIHPNAVFWIILPEDNQNIGFEYSLQTNESFQFDRKSTKVSLKYTELKLEKKIVRITKNGGYTLGSGFIVRDLGPLVSVFPRLSGIGSLPCDGVYIITAAHLFPSGFLSNSDADSYGGFERDGSLFSHSNVFNIQFNGSDIFRGAATLLAKNEEFDVAVLYLNSIGLPATMKEQNVAYCHDIDGLSFVSEIEGGDHLRVLGFTSEGAEHLISKAGYLAEYPTEDTSNFGPITKIKLKQQKDNSTVFAQDGMSGGPILTEEGQVAGIAIERPVTDNSLIGLDFTTIEETTGHDYFRNHSGDPSCVLSFNPFDRTLNLVNKNISYCNYGNFGSQEFLEPLQGEWVLQEVLAISGRDSNTENWGLGGHSWKNGHSIINGFTIIEGKNVLKSGSSLVVNHSNIESINASKIDQGFKLDKKSWASLVPVGVRILYSSTLLEEEAVAYGDLNFNSVISSIRLSKEDKGFTPIYSLRNFVIWLRQQSEFWRFEDNICFMGRDCN